MDISKFVKDTSIDKTVFSSLVRLYKGDDSAPKFKGADIKFLYDEPSNGVYPAVFFQNTFIIMFENAASFAVNSGDLLNSKSRLSRDVFLAFKDLNPNTDIELQFSFSESSPHQGATPGLKTFNYYAGHGTPTDVKQLDGIEFMLVTAAAVRKVLADCNFDYLKGPIENLPAPVRKELRVQKSKDAHPSSLGKQSSLAKKAAAKPSEKPVAPKPALNPSTNLSDFKQVVEKAASDALDEFMRNQRKSSPKTIEGLGIDLAVSVDFSDDTRNSDYPSFVLTSQSMGLELWTSSNDPCIVDLVKIPRNLMHHFDGGFETLRRDPNLLSYWLEDGEGNTLRLSDTQMPRELFKVLDTGAELSRAAQTLIPGYPFTSLSEANVKPANAGQESKSRTASQKPKSSIEEDLNAVAALYTTMLGKLNSNLDAESVHGTAKLKSLRCRFNLRRVNGVIERSRFEIFNGQEKIAAGSGSPKGFRTREGSQNFYMLTDYATPEGGDVHRPSGVSPLKTLSDQITSRNGASITALEALYLCAYADFQMRGVLGGGNLASKGGANGGTAGAQRTASADKTRRLADGGIAELDMQDFLTRMNKSYTDSATKKAYGSIRANIYRIKWNVFKDDSAYVCRFEIRINETPELRGTATSDGVRSKLTEGSSRKKVVNYDTREVAASLLGVGVSDLTKASEIAQKKIANGTAKATDLLIALADVDCTTRQSF